MASILKSVWRGVVPQRIRSSAFVTTLKTRIVPHNWMYDEDYYRTEVDTAATESAVGMSATLLKTFSPGSVIDVGCGTGALAKEMQELGIAVTGLEYADAAISICHERSLDVRKFDIEYDAPPSIKADLVVSFEVAEHLPEKIAERYIALLCSMSDQVVISAAPPGQGGTDHVNEQPAEYWIAKFQERGFISDTEKTDQVRAGFAESGTVARFYTENAFAFVRVT